MEKNSHQANIQDTLIASMLLSGMTIVSQPQKYTYDRMNVLRNNNDAISYKVNTDNDGIYDLSSNFPATQKSTNEKGSISGYVKGDTNASMAGRKVFIDRNRDGKLQENSEMFTVTDNKGYYAFTNLDKGSYSILEIPHQNWEVKKPLTAKYSIVLNSGQNIVNLNFENSFTKGKK